MAWRIDESVIRGVIDNRLRGRVTGLIWFTGRPDPKAGNIDDLGARQTGVIGDCTASRKVKVPEIPLEQIGEYYAARKPWPWHWGNSLYFEWFSDRNGRMVIESATFQLTIASDIAWEMTPAEEEQQRGANAEAMGGFMDQLEEATAANPAYGDAEWSEKPQTEAEAEKMQADSDRLADRINARMEREGPDADYEKILEEELERRRIERGEKPPTPEEEARRTEWIDEMNRAAEEALKNPDPEIEAELETKHPLAEQASDLSVRLMRDTEARGWVPADANAEHPMAEIVSCTMSAGAKLAGALNGESWPPSVGSCAGKIVRLKRARGYLDDALLAAEACVEQKLTDDAWLAGVQRELNALGHECDLLIDELRARLARGFD
jgi:hypothetical protein